MHHRSLSVSIKGNNELRGLSWMAVYPTRLVRSGHTSLVVRLYLSGKNLASCSGDFLVD
jgi:hypothetical protein